MSTSEAEEREYRPKWSEATRRQYVNGWQRGASGEKPNPLLATDVYMSGYDAGKQALADAKSNSYFIGGLIERFSEKGSAT